MVNVVRVSIWGRWHGSARRRGEHRRRLSTDGASPFRISLFLGFIKAGSRLCDDTMRTSRYSTWSANYMRCRGWRQLDGFLLRGSQGFLTQRFPW